MKSLLCFAILGVVISLVSCASGEKSSLAVHDEKIFLAVGEEETAIAELAKSDDWPFALVPTYSFASDSSKIAFIGHKEKKFEIYFFVLGMKKPAQIAGEGIVDNRTSIAWSPNDSLVLCNRGERIWIYDTKADSAWMLSEPQENWMEDYDPSFSFDGSKVFFFRGSRFEYVFSGDKYSINLDGIGLKKEKEETPTYPPEDLRGEDY